MTENVIQVSCDLRGFNKWASSAVARQIPFATAKSLTKLAQAVQAKERAELPKHFTLRSGGVARGIRFTPASKRDWPNCKAEVGSLDEFMVLQETGGTKLPLHSAAGHSGVPGGLAIPSRTGLSIANLRGPSGKIPKSRRPKGLIRAKKAFAQDNEIRLRLPGDSNPKAPVAYFIRPQATIKPRFHFADTAQDVVQRTFAAVFATTLEDALKPRR